MDNQDLNNLVVVSDLHCGCRLGLCPPEGASLDDGGTYLPSNFQAKTWAMWREFWDDFVPDATRGEPFGVVVNGDVLDGVHHKSTTQISHNLEDQSRIARDCLLPISELCDGKIWMVRGTEAHVASSAREEERLAREVGAIPNAEGQHARWDLWKVVGGEKLVHFLHHIGTTGSQAYEATAVHKELVEELTESARWGDKRPDMIVRSHRHRCIETAIPVGSRDQHYSGRAVAVVTPAWQGKTPFVWKIPGGRLAPPQFGGLVIRFAHGRLFVDWRIWTIERSKAA